MSKVLVSLAIAGVLSGCATTGGKVAFSAAAISTVVAASSFHFELFCGSQELGPCPDNTQAEAFAGVALASALLGATFEIAHALRPEPSTQPTAPLVSNRQALDCSTVEDVLPATSDAQLQLDSEWAACLAQRRASRLARPPAIGIVDALAAARQFAVAHAFAVDDRYLRSRFDYSARNWVFAWPTATDVTTIVVTESGRTIGQRTAPGVLR